MNILDLKKGDKVYGGLTRSGNGFATHVGYQELLEVRSAILRNGTLITGGKGVDFSIRLSRTEGDGVIYACELHDASIYATEEDFLDGNAIQSFNIPVSDVVEKLAAACGLRINKDGFPEVWRWNPDKKIAESRRWIKEFNLADPQLPKGSYATKEECERANRKTIKMAVHKTLTRYVEVEADSVEEANEWIDENYANECDPSIKCDTVGDYFTEVVTD